MRKNEYLCSIMTEIYLVRHGETLLRIVMTEIYLVRHGETLDNARQVAERLAKEHFDAIVASDLHRSVQTAEIIAAPHGLPVRTTPLLRERDWGSFTGRFIPDLRHEVWPDDIESEEALLLRAREFLIYITTTWPDSRVVAVGHGIVNKAILAVYAQCAMREVARMMNCEIRVLTTSAERAAASATVTSTAVASATTASAE